MSNTAKDITDILGKIQYRIALAGGWIDQPFMSKLNPSYKRTSSSEMASLVELQPPFCTKHSPEPYGILSTRQVHSCLPSKDLGSGLDARRKQFDKLLDIY